MKKNENGFDRNLGIGTLVSVFFFFLFNTEKFHVLKKKKPQKTIITGVKKWISCNRKSWLNPRQLCYSKWDLLKKCNCLFTRNQINFLF